MHRSRNLTLLAVALAALAARLGPVAGIFPGTSGVDDGVYYSAARALSFGLLPYRDFTFVHPPGIAWLLAPLGHLEPLIGEAQTIGLVRLAIMAMGAATAVLLAALAWRYGQVAALVAGLLYAVYPAPYERSVFLEAPLNLFLVLAALAARRAISRSRLAPYLAGVAMAVALSMKLWAAGPIAVMVLFVAHRRGMAALGRVAAGLAVGALFAFGPFLAASPSGFAVQTLLAQAGRERTPSSLGIRLGLMTADGPTAAGVTAVIVAALAVLIAAGAGLMLHRRGHTLPEWGMWTCVGLVAAAELLVAPSFFEHYWSFLCPWLSLVLGVGAGAAARWSWRRAKVPGVRLAVGTIGLGVAAIAAVNALSSLANAPKWLWRSEPELAQQAETPKCRFSRTSAALVEVDALSDNLRRGCEFPLDWTGMLLLLDAGHGIPEERRWGPLREDGGLYGTFARLALASDRIIARDAWAGQLRERQPGLVRLTDEPGLNVYRP